MLYLKNSTAVYASIIRYAKKICFATVTINGRCWNQSANEFLRQGRNEKNVIPKWYNQTIPESISVDT